MGSGNRHVALVVDDSMLIRHTVCRFLEERGFAVESATNGKEALDLLTHIQPTLIITDIQMPKMDGRQLIAALKSDPRTADIPIVVLAGRQNGSEQEVRGHYAISKDIEINSQLQNALIAILGTAVGTRE
jgi:CheY-like chemotaxis protein